MSSRILAVVFVLFSGVLTPGVFCSAVICVCASTAYSDEHALGLGEHPTKSPLISVEKSQSLGEILLTIKDTQNTIRTLQRRLRTSAAKGREDEILSKIKDKSEKLAQLQTSFIQIATGIDESKTVFNESISFSQELHSLLFPLLGEIRRLTDRPREIDEHKREIENLSERKESIEWGIKNVDSLLGEAKDRKLIEKLKTVKKDLLEKHQETQTQLAIVGEQLERVLGEKHDFISSVKDLFNLFFRSRVRNLFIAFLATLLFWMIFRQIFSRIQKIPHFRREQKSFQIRLFNVAFLFFTGIGAVLVFLLVLFILHDWVLFTLGVMVLLGAVWSSKQAIPLFWSQAAVLLNMGSVREGERVVYNGIPWKVRSLSFYSFLVNKELDGGELRLPIQEMPGLRSRRFGQDEPWFPTRKNDWVLLADGTYGKVIEQGPESVVVKLLGGARKTYCTDDFIAKDPTVLSSGFRHCITFGIDYKHQAEIVEKIPSTLEKELQERLMGHGFETKLKSLSVEFEEAGESSLNLAVIANFSGEAASEYETLARLIQRFCVDSCNKHAWIIPFEQLTVHMDAA